MPFSPYAARRDRLREVMAKAGRRGVLVTRASDRYYLSGFEPRDPQCGESSGWLVVTDTGRDKLLTDPRYLDAAKRLWPEQDIFIYAGRRWEAICAFLSGLGLGRLVFDPRGLSVDAHAHLVNRVDLEPVPDCVGRLRRIKDAAEIALIRRALEVNKAVFEALPNLLVPGVSEAELAWEAEKFCRDHGADAMSFDTIVGVGANAALPHAEPGPAKITGDCLVLVDLGTRVNAYCSDQTRTFWVGGRGPDHFRRALERVQKAQAKAIAGLHPGLSFKDAYVLAWDYFNAHGEAAHFTHALGHGIGLEVHEYPSLSPSAEGELAAGMVVTVEPGLYYPEWGGVRWEHMVLITEDGAEIL